MPVPALAALGHGHISLRQALAHLPAAVCRDYFKFAFVRHPFDRFVSACAMLNRRNPDYAGRERTFMKNALKRPRFRNRVLVRPQVPHMGEVAVKAGRGEVVDHINLRSGETRKLTVVTEPEEGFDGEIALTLENLPTGVQALAAATTTVNPRLLETGNGRGAMHKERFFPSRRLATIVLVAGGDAPATPMPQRIRLTARPIVDGKIGKALAVQEILLMICRPETEQAAMAARN